MNCPYCTQIGKDVCKIDSYSIVHCSDCNIAFTFPPPVIPDYTDLDFHSAAAKSDDATEKLTEVSDLPHDWKWMIAIQRKMAEHHLQKNKRILEIGCGEGILLAELSTLGFDVTGIEPSRSASRRAAQRGLKVLNGSFPETNPEGKFDLVIMSQVLEHIFDIETFIESLKSLTSAENLLFTQTNFRGLIPRFLGQQWYAWVPDQHYWHFTLKGLTKILSRHNFELVDYKYSSLVHPHNILYKIASLRESWYDQFTAIYSLKKDKIK
jgi:SAM-dependent methyltransferase